MSSSSSPSTAAPNSSSSDATKYHNMPAMIGPSLLACDMSNMSGESKRVMDAGADFLHLDVMDGHFVPNLTFGAPVITCLRKNTNAILDVHLMVTNPENWVDDMKAAGADYFTFHVEVAKVEDKGPEGFVTEDLEPLIMRIKAAGMKVGLAIKPKTPVDAVFKYGHLLDLILVMTVEPGFGGQKFNGDMVEKIRILRDRYPTTNIEVDGGLSPDTIDVCAKAGANMIVAGSAVFKADPAPVIAALKRSIEIHGNGKL